MARTAAPAAPVAAPPAQPPPAAPDRPTTVLAWPSEWPVPVPPAPSRARRRAERGLPMAPVLGAAGNATALSATAAYQIGGPLAVAATGVVVAGAATAAVVRRRATVRRSMASRASDWGLMAGGRRQSGGGSLRLGGGGSSSGSGARRGGSGSGAGRRSGGGPLGSSRGGGLGSKAPSGRHKSGAGSGLSGLGSGGKGRHAAGPASGGRGAQSLRSGAGKPKAGKAAGIKAAAARAARAAAKPGSTPRKIGAAVGSHTLGRKSLPYKGAAALGRGAKAGTKRAWSATAPVRSKSRAAAGRQLKRLRGAALDGLRSVLAGAWAGIKKRDRKAALARLREVWTRRRKTRTDKTTPAPPAVASSVRRPTATTPTSTGVTAVSGHHFTASAQEMCRAAANYQPTGMLQVGADFAGLEEALQLNAEAMKITVENADTKFPLAPQIIETMRQIHSLQLKAAELARELQPAFQKLHDVDIARLENPRKGFEGERMWDVTSNL